MDHNSSRFDESKVTLELDQIQSIILRSRPIPYFGTVVLVEIKDKEAGKTLIKNLLPELTTSVNWHNSNNGAATIAISYKGFIALGLPKETLDSFPNEFKAGMAGRHEKLTDYGENHPDNWQYPYKDNNIHILVNIIADSEEKWKNKLKSVRDKFEDISGYTIIAMGDFSATEKVTNAFGFRDGLSQPEVDGSGVDIPPGYGRAVKAGEFIIGYPGEAGNIDESIKPLAFSKNGSFVALRKYRSNVHLFNQFLHKNGKTPEERELLAAKLFGRWRSGVPLALSPKADDPELATDRTKINNFDFKDDDYGRKTPLSCHMRRMYPRDTKMAVMSDLNMHRIIRRGVAYGGVPGDDFLEDDGKERGLYFLGISAKAMQTMEFLQSEWGNTGNFINHGDEKDPVIGVVKEDEDGVFTLPKEEGGRVRIHGVKTFNTLVGGEYLFIPGINGLKWILDQE
ncbi:Dyp-type peroxidase family [Chryseobacterium rhizosphaerae]|uniref:Dyp-type peroxidase family n=1 Tax=Chryseobacterium rhizosphaerae TaxID=395937 RepID=A0AAE3YD68_9FLAO|nr:MULTISPECIES: peroxidase [Chryseobacterium]MBL3546583.1 peroxidase [Chryseobacterium sp. KMC2]MDR6528627.1 Dyp-type peroxidase family [Chryseobacterium rhizosphaerae]